MKLTWTQRLIWLALIMALAYSWPHVAWTFASVEGGNVWPGYIGATAIDLGILALGLAIQERRRVRREVRSLWAGVVVFSAISMYANWLYGVIHAMELPGVPLATLRPLILSAVAPLLVLYLSEIAGSDVQHAAKIAEREERRAAKRKEPMRPRTDRVPLGDRIGAIAATTALYAQGVRDPVEIGALIGRSPRTVGGYLRVIAAGNGGAA